MEAGHAPVPLITHLSIYCPLPLHLPITASVAHSTALSHSPFHCPLSLSRHLAHKSEPPARDTALVAACARRLRRWLKGVAPACSSPQEGLTAAVAVSKSKNSGHVDARAGSGREADHQGLVRARGRRPRAVVGGACTIAARSSAPTAPA